MKLHRQVYNLTKTHLTHEMQWKHLKNNCEAHLDPIVSSMFTHRPRQFNRDHLNHPILSQEAAICSSVLSPRRSSLSETIHGKNTLSVINWLWLPAWWALWASLVTTSRMQQCFNVLIDIYHEFLLLFYCCVLLEIKLTTTTTTKNWTGKGWLVLWVNWFIIEY